MYPRSRLSRAASGRHKQFKFKKVFRFKMGKSRYPKRVMIAGYRRQHTNNSFKKRRR